MVWRVWVRPGEEHGTVRRCQAWRGEVGRGKELVGAGPCWAWHGKAR